MKVGQSCPTLCDPIHSLGQPMDFSRPEYWSGQPFPPPGDLPQRDLNPGLLHCRRILYLVSHQESLRLQWLPAYQYSLNPTNLMELNTWKNVKRKPKVKISFNGKRATKKEFLKSTKQAITVKINTQELNMDEMREWRDGDWAKLSSQT